MANRDLVVLAQEDREVVDVIKSTVYGGDKLSDAELKVFLVACEQSGVHPLAKGVHIWKDGSGRVGLAVSVHTMTAHATKDGKGAIVDYEWEFDTQTSEPKTGKILSCTCVGEVWDERTGAWKQRKATIRREDVAHLFNKDNWKNQPFTMWENRARAKWCRMHRADVCGPLYSSEEVEELRDVAVQTPFGPERVTFTTRATEIVDAKLLEPANASPATAKTEPAPVVAPQTPTPRPEDVQAAKKARWQALCLALACSPADIKADVKVACQSRGIPVDAAEWTDEQAKAIESEVRAMRAAPAIDRQPGEDD